MTLKELLVVLSGDLEIAVYKGDRLADLLKPTNVFNYENEVVEKVQIWRPDDCKSCRVNITLKTPEE